MEDRPTSVARLLAPIALGVGLLALIVVLLTSGILGGGDAEAPAPKAASQQKEKAQTQAGEGRRSKGREDDLPSSTYTVKTNDTLGDIASKTGMSVERLQELNPEVDAQSLVSGQKLKLRE